MIITIKTEENFLKVFNQYICLANRFSQNGSAYTFWKEVKCTCGRTNISKNFPITITDFKEEWFKYFTHIKESNLVENPIIGYFGCNNCNHIQRNV